MDPRDDIQVDGASDPPLHLLDDSPDKGQPGILPPDQGQTSSLPFAPRSPMHRGGHGSPKPREKEESTRLTWFKTGEDAILDFQTRDVEPNERNTTIQILIGTY